MAQTGGGDLIGADPAVGGRDTPLRLHELRFEQALERWIERSFFHLEQVVRSLLDVLDERVPMGGLAAKRLEDHHFECTGKEIARRGCFHRLYGIRHRLNKYQPFGKGKAWAAWMARGKKPQVPPLRFAPVGMTTLLGY